MDWTNVVLTLLTAVLLPLAGVWVQRYVADARLAQWSQGALAAAGRVAIAVEAARRRSPDTPIDALLRIEVAAEAERFLRAYAQTARQLRATAEDAASRIQGEAGRMLLAAGPPPVIGELSAIRPDEGLAIAVAEQVATRLRPAPEPAQ
ncbi:hypothetical protein [Falsiroseomonas selenitidurans]|uniref:Uncharacterized protein n=1 Tax=Falsiroseomonas selenitidurans TaxID=2716335 RepID=A0ABX1DZ77_9PROT|nr:hypothetical protein [Falsiroseomonas selenitidurans]NKC30212.1 hypothetical protein [Falsiroseomonas selenitidurans]